MITTEDPSGNGIVAFGLFDLCGGMDLMPHFYADMSYVQIAGKTKYKKFERARNYAWLHHGEPLFIRLYQDKETGKWNYHRIGCWWQTRRDQSLPGAQVLTLAETTAIVDGGRSYLDRLLKGEAII